MLNLYSFPLCLDAYLVPITKICIRCKNIRVLHNVVTIKYYALVILSIYCDVEVLVGRTFTYILYIKKYKNIGLGKTSRS